MIIEKNVPMLGNSAGRPRLYPFPDMDVGDSLFFENANPQSSPAKVAHQYAAKSGRKFSARAVEGGLRIWRVA